MSYNVRIDDNFLRADHVDGEVLQHTDMNELESVAKLAINANYEDIQKLQDGTIPVDTAEKLDGATLSKFASETLQNSDTKVPTSSQVKQYIDAALSNIDLTGYYTQREIDTLLEGYVKPTDYATSSKGGVFRTNNGLSLDINGLVYADILSYVNYSSMATGDELFISKGTLENVITGKGLIDKTVNNLVNYYKKSESIKPLTDDTVNFNTIDTGLYYIVGATNIVVGDQSIASNFADNLVYVTHWSNMNTRIVSFLNLTTMYAITRSGSSGSYTYSLEKTFTYVTTDNLASELDNYYTKAETDTLLSTKANITDIPDLTDYVKNTNYATASKGGVIKSGYYGLQVDSTNGKAYCDTYSYDNYGNVENQRFVSKGTLENVITGKGLVSDTDYAGYSKAGVIRSWTQQYATDIETLGYLKAASFSYSQYVNGSNNMFISKGTLENVLDNRIGDIQTLLDDLDTGSGV